MPLKLHASHVSVPTMNYCWPSPITQKQDLLPQFEKPLYYCVENWLVNHRPLKNALVNELRRFNNSVSQMQITKALNQQDLDLPCAGSLKKSTLPRKKSIYVGQKVENDLWGPKNDPKNGNTGKALTTSA